MGGDLIVIFRSHSWDIIQALSNRKKVNIIVGVGSVQSIYQKSFNNSVLVCPHFRHSGLRPIKQCEEGLRLMGKVD